MVTVMPVTAMVRVGTTSVRGTASGSTSTIPGGRAVMSVSAAGETAAVATRQRFRTGKVLVDLLLEHFCRLRAEECLNLVVAQSIQFGVRRVGAPSSGDGRGGGGRVMSQVMEGGPTSTTQVGGGLLSVAKATKRSGAGGAEAENARPTTAETGGRGR